MLFSKNKKVDLVTLKEESPEVYASLIADIKTVIDTQESEALKVANAKIDELTKKTEREGINTEIIAYGKQLKVENIAKECIEGKMTLTDSLVKMVAGHMTTLKDIKDSFEETASNVAGANLDDSDKIDAEPKTFAEAIKLVSSRDKITKMEASIKAQVEFKELFDAQYEGVNRPE